MFTETNQQYDQAVKDCKDLFLKKSKDYGTSWRILRLPSVTDQIFIKAKRIRNISEATIKKINENIDAEFIGIINYSIIALIQLSMQKHDTIELPLNKLTALYDEKTAETKKLMENKNHDYGEAWRDLRVSSMTDLILMKLLRIKQIENNEGKTIISEGLASNYHDIINYAIFALIKLKENNK